MTCKEVLSSGTLALVDPDTRKLKWMEKIARRAKEAKGVPLTIEIATDHRKVLKGADFVILAFAVEGVRFRGVDADVSTRHGMIMCSADTIGPGGTMRTLREIPRQNAILKDVERICPDAWVINWVNPTSAMGIAMMRHFPHMKAMALCDGPHNPRFENDLIIKAGLASSAEKITEALRRRVKIRCGGVNHFTWLVEMTDRGRDVTHRIKQAMKRDSQGQHIAASEAGKTVLTNKIGSQLAEAVGYVPTCVWHTQEYLPYFQGHDVNKKHALKIRKWKLDTRRKWMRECWQDMQQLASGKRPIEDFLQNTIPDQADDIIECMWAGIHKRFYINTRNNGAVTNMTDDAFLEIPCTVDMNAVYPLAFGEMPRPLPGFMQRVLDEHELAVEAAMTCDRNILRKAFLASMVAVSIPDVEACLAELLRRERAFLPKKWFR